MLMSRVTLPISTPSLYWLILRYTRPTNQLLKSSACRNSLLTRSLETPSLEDVHEHMSWWACFDQPKETRPQAVPAVKPDKQASFYTKSQNRPKPKRNDPCWCGSGKKYKYCH
jgi:uncharacterized protein YchJ